MSAYEIHEPGRGRLLPRPAAQHTTIASWPVQCTFDADHRRKHPAYRDLAARLIVVQTDGEPS